MNHYLLTVPKNQNFESVALIREKKIATEMIGPKRDK